MSSEDYHADSLPPVPTLSRGVIKDLLDCPMRAYWNHPRLNPKFEPKVADKFDLGKAAHSLFLEGIDNAVIIDAPDYKTKAAQEAKIAARKANKTPLLVSQYNEVKLMVEMAHEALWITLGLKIEEGESERSYYWKENETWMKIRPDWFTSKKPLCLDYKTTGLYADPKAYSTIVSATGLDIQKAFYCRGIMAVERVDPFFYFLVQETDAPYLCTFIKLDPLFEEMGEQKVHRGIKLWRESMESGVWPGYGAGIQIVEPQAWQLTKWEEKNGGE